MTGETAGFLTPEPVLYHAHATGFALFGPAHLTCLAASLALAAAVLVRYLRLPAGLDGPRRTMLLMLSGTAVGIVAVKCATYVALGILEPLFWPLHICNLCEYIALSYALAPRSRVGAHMGDLLFCWGLTGCPAALLFPGWSAYCPATSLASICGFAEHALVLACALCAVAGENYVPHPQRVWFVVLASVLGGAVFRVLNPLWGTNFFFVTNPAAAGGPGPWLVATFGDRWFLAAYLVLAVALWAALYGLYRAASWINRQCQGG